MIDYHTNWIMQYIAGQPPFEEFIEATDKVMTYLLGTYYDSKNDRLDEWGADLDAIRTTIAKVFVECLKEERQTYQTLIGRCAGIIDCADPFDRAKCIAEVIALCAQAELIDIEQLQSGSYMVSTSFALDEEIPNIDGHAPILTKPKDKTTNQILGGRIKQHNKETCLDHINRMNAVPLSLDLAVLDNVKEVPSFDIETIEQKEQWDHFLAESRRHYSNVIYENNNTFYMEHHCDTRGRCYCEGYYINYQGSSYKKAIVQLADKELVEG